MLQCEEVTEKKGRGGGVEGQEQSDPEMFLSGR